jgi:hypothetical protein
MALWRCQDCSTRYSVDAPRCPHCWGTDHTEDGEMPKIHANRPPTYATEPVEPPADDVVEESVSVEPDPEPAEEPAPRARRSARANAAPAAGTP